VSARLVWAAENQIGSKKHVGITLGTKDDRTADNNFLEVSTAECEGENHG
jgi:hypothetical protein